MSGTDLCLRRARDRDHRRTHLSLAVARSAGNVHLTTAIEDARASMFHPVDLATFEFVKESSHSQHQLVLDSIAQGDGAAASAAMRDHIDSSRAEMLRLIDDN